MSFEHWLFSARLAWQHPGLKWIAVTALLLVSLGSGYFLWRILPLRETRDTVVLHYNIYLGIDAVRHWSWALVLPATWLLFTLLDLAVSFSLYRSDAHLSFALAVLALAWSLPWTVALYYLTLVNL
jgi:hypothetical protein